LPKDHALPVVHPEPAQETHGFSGLSEITDRALHAALAKLTLGLSPAAVLSAQLHWLVHLATSPGKRFQLADKAMRKLLRYQTYAWRNLLEPGKVPPVIEPLPQDRRFRGEAWQQWPYNLVQQGFLLQQQWWHNATSGVRGVTRHHEAMVEFGARQLLDLFSPSNFLATNPELQQRTLETGGRNLVEGLQHLFEDWERTVNGRRPAGSEAYVVGGNVAATPGKVVFRNGLMELIQYEATTSSVRPEPLLIVPAWIMKYYILDLSSENSLIRYLTGQGFTVFAISWKNPTARDRDVGFDDYRGQGVMAAIDAIGAIVPGRQVHALGYCLGGTLLSIAAAAMARQGDNRLASITLLAAQVDFTEAGELMLFIDEGQVSFLEDMMWEQGFLDAKQMSGAFQLLRSNDLIWSKGLHRYLMGERDEMNDMMAWNADATRLPYRMHSEYLRQLFLNNDLAEGRYAAGGRTVMLADIRAPMFVVGTVHDHVAPWRSVYKIHHLVDAPVTFVLASGGHNAGIVAPIDRPGPWHQVMTHAVDARHLDSETWAVTAPQRDGSWWTTYAAWLAAHSGPPVAPPPLGNAAAGYVVLGDAPGTYVLEE